MAFTKNDYSASMQDVFALRLEMMNQIKVLQDAIAAIGGGGGGIDPSGIKYYTIGDQKTSNSFGSTSHTTQFYTTGNLQPKTLYLVSAKAMLYVGVCTAYDAVIDVNGTFYADNSGTLVYGGPHAVYDFIRITAPSGSATGGLIEYNRVFTLETGDFDPVPDPDNNINPGALFASFKLSGKLFGTSTALSSTHGYWTWRYAPAVAIPIAKL